MAFHESFWVAVATVGPVLGLAHVLAAGSGITLARTIAPARQFDLMRWVIAGRQEASREKPHNGPPRGVIRRVTFAIFLLYVPYFLSGLGFACSAGPTFIALDVLRTDRDSSMFVPESLLLAAFLALVVQVVSAAIVAATIRPMDRDAINEHLT